MKFKFFSIALNSILLLTLSCTDDTNSSSDFGRLQVQLTDAPFPHDLVAEANVTIFKVDVRYKGELSLDEKAMDSTETTVETDEGKSFVILMEEEIDVNLLNLTNGVTNVLADIDIPVGTYDLVRVYVKGVNVLLKDGTTYDLKVPSGSQSGIKVFVNPGISVNGGLSSDLLLDFDVSKSFVIKGSRQDISGFNFKPVIKASNLSTAGTLTGTISTIEGEMNIGVEGAEVAVFAADTLNTTTFSGMDGGYMIMGLNAGDYTVTVKKDSFNLQTINEVQINVANKTILDVALIKD